MRFIGAFLVLLICGIPYLARGYEPSLESILKSTKLLKDLSLENSSDVYSKFHDSIGKEGLVSGPGYFVEQSLLMAWSTNRKADEKRLTFHLHRGMTIYQAIEYIADRRGEFVSDRGEYVLVSPTRLGRRLQSYRQGDDDFPQAANDPIEPSGIEFIEAQGEEMETFLNLTLKDHGNKNAARWDKISKIRLDRTARARSGQANVVGCWSYANLLDAYSELLGLRWRVDGGTLWLEKPHEVQSK